MKKQSSVLLAGVILLAFFLVTTGLFLSQQQKRTNDPTADAAPNQEPEAKIQALSRKLERESQRLDKKASIKDIPEVAQIARERREEIIGLMISNPKAVKKLLLPPQALERIPQALLDENLVEKPFNAKGEVTTYIAEDFENGVYWYEHEYRDEATGKAYKVYNPEVEAFDPSTSGTVEIEGVEIGSIILANQVSKTEEAIALQNNLPNKLKIAVISYDFIDNQLPNYNPGNIKSRLISDENSLHQYLSSMTHNAVGVDSTNLQFFGKYTLPVLGQTMRSEDCHYRTYALMAQMLAEKDGYNSESYDLVMNIGPRPYTCGYAAAYGELTRSTTAPLNTYFFMTNINGSDVGSDVIKHEIGHNLGMHHANSLVCRSANVPVEFNDTKTGLAQFCDQYEYGDSTDVMGVASNNHFNAYHQLEMGNLSLDDFEIISDDTSIEIFNLHSSSSGKRGAFVRAADTYYYYLFSYRQPDDLFNKEFLTSLNTGAHVHLVENHFINTNQPYQKPKILDMQAMLSDKETQSSMTDSQTFVDTATGLEVTQISHTNDSVVLDFNFQDDCRIMHPIITTKAVKDSIHLGETSTHEVTITNKNSLGCPDSNISIRFSTNGSTAESELTDFSIASKTSKTFLVNNTIPGSSVYNNPFSKKTITMYVLADGNNQSVPITTTMKSRYVSQFLIAPSTTVAAKDMPIEFTVSAFDLDGIDITNELQISWPTTSESYQVITDETNPSKATVVPIKEETSSLYINVHGNYREETYVLYPKVDLYRPLQENYIYSVEMQPNNEIYLEPGEKINVSALAYNFKQEPLHEDIQYNWSLSSNGSIVRITENGSLAEIEGLGYGYGNLWVTARNENNELTKSVKITIGEAITQNINLVDITPTDKLTFEVGEEVHFSALAYDQQNNPIWKAVSYDWGASTNGSLLRISPNKNIASVKMIGPGFGDMWVTATDYYGDTKIKSIPIEVTAAKVYNRADLNKDYIVDVSDYVMLVKQFYNQGSGRLEDITEDGIVDVSDYIEMLKVFYQRT